MDAANNQRDMKHHFSMIANRVYLIYAVFVFFVLFTLFFPFFLVGLFIRNDRFGLVLNRYLCQTYCALIGIRVVVENKHFLQEDVNYIFCPNHFSFLDILSMPHVPVPFKFVGKLSLASIPLFGYYYKNYHILVNRDSRKSSYQAYQKSIEALRNGYSLTVFPEGGIQAVNSVRMSKFKRGPFKMAIETGTKLVPVTIADNWSILPDDGQFRISWKRESRMIVHKPVNPLSYDVDNIGNLQAKVYNVIQDELNRRNVSTE